MHSLQSSFGSISSVPCESHTELLRLEFSSMKWSVIKFFSSDQVRRDFLKEYYQVCPHCSKPCPGEPMCPTCHSERIYEEEYRAVFDCHCWEMGLAARHECGTDETNTPNWLSPLEELSRGRRPKKGDDPVLLPGESQSLANLALPPEILSMIFGFLDAETLASSSRVCRRWEYLVELHFDEEGWKDLVLQRWPLFKPYKEVQSWLLTYYQMLESVPCKPCLLNVTGGRSVPNFSGKEGTSRDTRLESEISGLALFKPVGIDAMPLDDAKYNWTARIEGPAQSPYQGGVFYISLSFPRNYPYQAPICRMLTKIIHPNISRHGEIGLKLLKSRNWTACNTVRSCIVDIQNLLAAPSVESKNPRVDVLEPFVADLFSNNHSKFLKLAKVWTRRFCCHNERVESIKSS